MAYRLYGYSTESHGHLIGENTSCFELFISSMFQSSIFHFACFAKFIISMFHLFEVFNFSIIQFVMFSSFTVSSFQITFCIFQYFDLPIFQMFSSFQLAFSKFLNFQSFNGSWLKVHFQVFNVSLFQLRQFVIFEVFNYRVNFWTVQVSFVLLFMRCFRFLECFWDCSSFRRCPSSWACSSFWAFLQCAHSCSLWCSCFSVPRVFWNLGLF